jgi:hypothetical protein
MRRIEDEAQRARFIAKLDEAIAGHNRTIEASLAKGKVAPMGIYALRNSLQATRDKLAAQ